MGRVIGYVGTGDLMNMREKDIRALDVINIAFGKICDSRMVWDAQEEVPALERIRAVHPSIKILLSIGGWGADGFSQAAASEPGRKRMGESGAAIAQMYGLDGIDLDWEYPGSSLAGIASMPEDRENFTLLLQAVRKALDGVGNNKMLTIAAGGDTYYTRLTNMGEASAYLDYVQLMTYDLQGGFQKVTGHHAAVYPGRKNLFDSCMDKAVKAFLEAGVPARQLAVGIPFYSRIWKGVKGDGSGIGLEAETVGGYGPNYGELESGYIGKNGYRRYWDENALVPWLFDGHTFISYEDRQSMAIKISYVKEKGLAGVMFWEYKCDTAGNLTEYIRKEMEKKEG